MKLVGGGRFETSLGGPGGAFPETTWGIVARLRDGDPSRRRAGLEDLCRKYWKPIYHFIRVAWSKSNDDAKDLAQSFFLWLLDNETLARYAPEKGSFRAYLKGILRNFVSDHHKIQGALKRGGGVRILSLDADPGPAVPAVNDPEKAFDLAWRKEIFDVALAHVRAHFESSDRAVYVKLFEACDLAPAGERPSHKELAAKFGLKTADVANYLFAVRQKIRTEAQLVLAETVSDAGQFRDEWNELISA